MGRDIRLYLDNSVDLILVGHSAFRGMTAMSGEEHSIHRYGGNALKEVTLWRPKNRCKGNIKIEVVKEIW